MNFSSLKSQIYFLALLCCSTIYFLSQCKSKDEISTEGSDDYFVEVLLPELIDYNYHVKPILSDRCFKCHGPDKSKIEAGLSFATQESSRIALGDGQDHYAIVPGKPQESKMIDRIFSEDPALLMPPPASNLTLTDREKKILEKWIDQGADYKPHWAFLPIQAPEVPAISENSNYILNDIDAFIHDKLKENKLNFSPIASPERLVRRVAFDLTGLPPSVHELNFLIGENGEKWDDNQYEKTIDYYLNTDAYAENMTVKWLDIARYADTHGYQDDLERIMWPWRDWVIHAYKVNMPFDQFVTWQLAGDLLPNPTKEMIIATAFNRNHKITQEGGVIPEEYRVEYVADRTQTFGTAFLGLTVECARCHDHKYDPISQKDFYSLFAYFNNVPEKGLIEQYGAIPEPYIKLTAKEIDETLTFIQNLDTMQEIPLMVMEELDKPRKAYLLERGHYDAHGEEVQPETPLEILPNEFEKNRLGLAKWLFSSENPLTDRVAVNRIWAQLFGKGIVESSDDFGAQGSLPTHPQLLDHLASRFRSQGWDVRSTLKYIMMSHTYKQSSIVDKKLLAMDPDNRLYARGSRKRLSAEKIRDHILASSGLLNPIVGGPSVKPYQPPGLWEEVRGGGGGSTSSYVQDTGADNYRRSLYTFWKRTTPPPSMLTFDAGTRDFCMVERETTSTPLQALVMMNNPEVIQASANIASQAIDMKPSPEERIAYIFRALTSRLPSVKEVGLLKGYLNDERSNPNQELLKEIKSQSYFKELAHYPIDDLYGYTMVAYSIFNLDETITRS